MYRSLCAVFFSSGSVFIPPQRSSREVRPFFDPRVAMVYRRTWYWLQSILDTCSANSFFAGHCGHFFVSPIVPTNQLLFLHIRVSTGDPPSQVLVRVECWDWYSPLREMPVCVVLSIFPNEGEVRVLACLKMHLSQAVCVYFLALPCRTLLEVNSNLRRKFTYKF